MISIDKPDYSDPISIESYAKKLIGHTFLDVLKHQVVSSEGYRIIREEEEETYIGSKHKGKLGNLIEVEYFGYEPNSKQEPDFKKAGVELKVSPFEYDKEGNIRAGERVTITMISYKGPTEDDFYKSHLWEKMKLILFIFYWRNRLFDSFLHYQIKYVKLFTPPKRDLLIIENDYKIIVGKIKSGNAQCT